MSDTELTRRIIGAAIEVHRLLGPGLLESAYEECLCHEMTLRGLHFEKQKPVPLVYKNAKLDCGFRLDNVRILKDGIRRLVMPRELAESYLNTELTEKTETRKQIPHA